MGSVHVDITGDEILQKEPPKPDSVPERPSTPVPPSIEQCAEMEKRRKMFERMERMEATRRRAEEALRKRQQELRERKERELKKHKRVGGGFIVPFDPPSRSKRRSSKSEDNAQAPTGSPD